MAGKFWLTLLIILSCCAVSAQEIKPANDFSKVDSLALTIKYDGDIYRLTKQLTSPFPDPLFKVRAIFRWITDNICYDYKFYNRTYYKGREPEGFSCNGDSIGCNVKKQVWEISYINKMLDNKKAVCQGYSMLFKKMCNIIGIESEVVPGYVRTKYYEVGTPGNLDHAWNIVRLNTNNYLVDATWAAGGCAEDDDGKLLPFQKHFNNHYWLTPPEEFAKNHYPEDAKWVLLTHYTKENFSANPYYASDEVDRIKLIAPSSGIITAKRGDTIKFKLKYDGRFKILQINSNIFQNPDIWYFETVKHLMIKHLDTFAVKKQRYINYKQHGDTYDFSYVVMDYTLAYLDILFDTKRVMRFKVSVR